MIFYFLLIISTLIIFLLTFLLWERTKNLSFIIGSGFLYYWSLYGAWFIIYNKEMENSIFRYQYLEGKLFFIYLDYYYFLTLFIYSLFIWIILGILLLLVKKPRFIENKLYLTVSHKRLILIGIIALLVSFLIIANDIFKAISSDVTIYSYTRFSGNSFFTLHQLFNRMATLSLVLGFSVYLSGENSKIIRGEKSRFISWCYIIALFIMFIYLMILGNKNELFFAFIAGFLIYLINSRKPKIKKIILLSSISLILFGFIDAMRGFRYEDIFSQAGLGNFINGIFYLFTSNEAFAAHFSLYGILSKDIAFTYGTSILSLVFSAVPRIFWPDRPTDIYQYYVSQVGAATDQGYTIHHAAGWYLNFGIFGVFLGAMLFALIWAFLFNRFYTAFNRKSLFFRTFFLIVPWTFVGYIPTLIRAGAEIYKGVIIEAMIIPAVIFFLASINLRQSKILNEKVNE